jgi:hypothetical protein
VSTYIHDLKAVCELRGSWRCIVQHHAVEPNLNETVCLLAGVPVRRSRASFQRHCDHLRQRAQMLQQPSWGYTPRALSGSSLLNVCHCFLRSLALEVVTGPGSRDPRSLGWSGGALAGTWVDLLLMHNDPARNTCTDDIDVGDVLQWVRSWAGCVAG